MSPQAKQRASVRMQFYTLDEVADALSVSVKTVRRRISAGDLIAHQIGRNLRISEADFQAFVALQRGRLLSS